MKVVLCKVGKEAQITDIDNDLETLQNIVGGWIEVIHPFEDRDVCVVLNEEGKLRPLPVNRELRDSKGRILDILCGDFIICYAPPTAEDFEDMPKELVEKYCKLYGEPLSRRKMDIKKNCSKGEKR